ncbi:hypothetical protein ACWF82_05365 [Nocardia sp. NPDC055053]
MRIQVLRDTDGRTVAAAEIVESGDRLQATPIAGDGQTLETIEVEDEALDADLSSLFER